MVKPGNNNIDIFLRIRPVPKLSPRASYDLDEGKVDFHIPRDLAAGYVNNQREHYEFRFTAVLPPETKQEEVFERLACPVVDGSLEGVNGTIFAYGQTGSGKTFTITGGPERYADRGLIPRSISHIFKQTAARGDHIFTVHISYMEIYNEVAYDLLDPSRDIKDLEDLPRVSIMEDEEGRYNLHNLSVHRAQNEEEALNLLFLGDTNRMISETPMNMASSRSHCVFTLYIEARRAGEDTLRKSKLNLVDLAGSERVKKTGIEGQTLKEAKYINLSLHFLEQVIIGLQERAMGIARSHIPYRNSLMSMVLRDSLGGNCYTAMIANVNLSSEQLDETISTCRFAQRVAMISNKVTVNEEQDPTLIIRRLKQENRDLKDEIRLLQGGADTSGPVTAEERARLESDIVAFIKDQHNDQTVLNLGSSMLRIRAALDIFKEICRKLPGAGREAGRWEPGALPGAASRESGPSGKGATAASSADSEPLQGIGEEVKKLRLQIQQRDNEINILVSMLKKRGGPIAAAGPHSDAPNLAAGNVLCGSEVAENRGRGSEAAGMPPQQELLDMDVLKDRNRSFELFRKSYRKNAAIEDNKQVLREKYAQAKALGSQVNADKARINELKSFIEQRRIQRSAAEIAAGGQGLAANCEAVDEQEEAAKAEIERAKQRYKGAFEELRASKTEIEHLQLLLEQSRKRMIKDFEDWFGKMARQQQASSLGGHPGIDTASVSGSLKALSVSTSSASQHLMAPGPPRSGFPAPHDLSTSQGSAWGGDRRSPGVAGSASASSSSAAQALQLGVAPPRTPAAVARTGEAFSGSGGREAQTPGAREARALAPKLQSHALQLSHDGGEAFVDVLQAANHVLTGDARADTDILAFYAARQKLLASQ